MCVRVFGDTNVRVSKTYVKTFHCTSHYYNSVPVQIFLQVRSSEKIPRLFFLSIPLQFSRSLRVHQIHRLRSLSLSTQLVFASPGCSVHAGKSVTKRPSNVQRTDSGEYTHAYIGIYTYNVLLVISLKGPKETGCRVDSRRDGEKINNK